MSGGDSAAADRAITAGSDFLQLDIGKAPVGGRAEWLAGQLRLAIADGRLPMGSRLPATRTLAADLRVSRGVVTDAYQRLVDDGQLAGRGRGGTIVVAAPVRAPASPPTRPAPTTTLFTGEPGVDIFDAVRAAPARIDLTPGVPDLAAFPRTAWLRAERTVLAALPSAAALGYGDPKGALALRQAVANWLARNRGIRVEPAEVIIVAGVAQALSLLAQVLIADGVTEVAVEDPSSLGTRQHLHNWGVVTPPIPVDGNGIRVDELPDQRAVLVTPAHQFPTGVVLDGDRRRELIRWAGNDNRLIIEDDYDAEHRYDRPPVPALRALLPEHVCYAGSVSKLLAPALRIGWLLATPRYSDALVAAKRHADLGNATLPQLVLAELMESGQLERHLRMLRGRHRRRRDAMITAIRTHLPGAVVHGAAAGLHLMVTFDRNDFDDTELATAALAHGVKVQPLSWHRQRPGPPGLVLGYAGNPPSELTAAIATLGPLARAIGN